MLRKYLIPNITSEVEKIIRKENLFLAVPVRQAIKETILDPAKHSFYIRARGIKGERLFLKVRIYNTLKEKTAIRHEIWMADFLRKTKNRALKNITSCYLKTNTGKVDWLIKKFDLGRFLGSRYELDKSLFTEKDIHSVIKILKLVQKISPEIRSKRTPLLQKGNHLLYKKKFFEKTKKYAALKEYISPRDIEKCKRLFASHRDFLDRHAHVLAHGDFQPANFIKTKQGIKIIDWDTIHINNYLYDATYFWIHMWRRPKLRKIFMERYFKKSGEKNASILFRLDALYLLFIQLKSLVKYLKSKDVLRKKAFFVHLNSFYDLLNRKNSRNI